MSTASHHRGSVHRLVLLLLLSLLLGAGCSYHVLERQFVGEEFLRYMEGDSTALCLDCYSVHDWIYGVWFIALENWQDEKEPGNWYLVDFDTGWNRDSLSGPPGGTILPIEWLRVTHLPAGDSFIYFPEKYNSNLLRERHDAPSYAKFGRVEIPPEVDSIRIGYDLIWQDTTIAAIDTTCVSYVLVRYDQIHKRRKSFSWY